MGEVLYCYHQYDELVLMNLAQFDKKNLKSIENEAFEDKSESGKVDESDGSLSQEKADDLLAWLKVTLGNRVTNTKITNRLESHPCVITVMEMVLLVIFLIQLYRNHLKKNATV